MGKKIAETNLEKDLKILIRFLAVHEYPQPLSLPLLQTCAFEVFWQIIDFLLKLFDYTLFCTNTNELIKILKTMGYIQTITVKTFTDEVNWGKMISICVWLSQRLDLLTPPQFSPFDRYFFQLCDQGGDPVPQDLFSNLAGNYAENVEKLSKEIFELTEEKKKIGNLPIDEVEEKILIANNEIYEDIEKISRLEPEFSELQKVNKEIKGKLYRMLGGRELNEDLIGKLKLELNKVQGECFEAVSKLNEYQSKVELTREEIELAEKKKGNSLVGKKLLETQEKIDLVRTNNRKVSEDLRKCKENIGEVALNISGFQAKFKKEEKQILGIISDDREAISRHARKVADWLKSTNESS